MDVDDFAVSRGLSAWEYAHIPALLDRPRWLWIRLLLGVLVVGALIPWTQTVTATGKISSYSPYERPQTIEARISGRIKAWHVYEGIRVKEGELLLELKDINPQFMAPDLILQLQVRKDALERLRDAALERADRLEHRIQEMLHLVVAAVPAAGARLRESERKVLRGEQRLVAAQIARDTAELNIQRQRLLARRGLISQRELEVALQQAIATHADVEGAKAELGQAKEAAKALTFERSQIEADVLQRLKDARAARDAAFAEAARAMDHLAETALRLSNAVERRDASMIYAPVSGTVVRMARLGAGETVQEGENLMVVTPESDERALEMVAETRDAPLVTPGRRIRLLFYGTPPVQLFSWPEHMAGTFWGIVKVVDQDSLRDGTVGQGRFRFWVVEDPDERPWPGQDHVRQGTTVMGWVVADRVPLIKELLRRLIWLPPRDDAGVSLLDKDLGKAGTKAIK